MFTIKTQKTTTPTTNELIRKADQQLLQLQQDIDQVQTALTQAQARIDQISQAALQRTEELTTAYNHIHEYAESVERARSYADLATGTRQEHEAGQQLKQAQAELSKAQSLYDQDSERATREQKKEEELTCTAREHMTKKQQELNDLYNRQASMSASREQAITERGRTLFQTAMTDIQHQQSRINAMSQCVEREQESLVKLLEHAVDELADYPDLVGQIREIHPQDDATSRVLKAAITHIDILLTERGEMADTLTLPSTRYVTHFLGLFALPEEDLWRMKGNPGPLTTRREKLEQVLSEYRESRR